MSAFDRSVSDADPAVLVEDSWASAVYEEIVAAGPPTSRRRPRRRFIFPVIAIGLVALTGAAVAVVSGLGQLGANGQSVDYDVVVPIEYADASGGSHRCSYGFYVGDGAAKSPGAVKIIDWLRDHNWGGVGQAVFDYAEQQKAAGIDGPEDYRRKAAFSDALSVIVLDAVPTEFLSGDDVVATSSDCEGEGLSW